MPSRKSIPQKLRDEILQKCNNQCCICQKDGIQIHHIDGNASNNDEENLAPLCPNHHDEAGLNRQLGSRLSLKRIKMHRDKWYERVEAIKQGFNPNANAVQKLKNFVQFMGFAKVAWSKSFTSVDPSCREMKRNDIIDRVFSTNNAIELETRLSTVKYMYPEQLSDEENLRKFREVCTAFGLEYDDLM